MFQPSDFRLLDPSERLLPRRCPHCENGCDRCDGQGTLPRSYVSVSSARLFERCPLAHHLRYVRKQPGDTSNGYMIFGSAMHRLLEWLNRTYIETSDYPHPPSWRAMCEGILEDYRLAPGARITMAGQLQQLMHAYLSAAGLQLQPIQAEDPFLIARGDDFFIYGVIDIITSDGLWDYKVTMRPMSRERLDHDDQLNLYGLAYLLRYGRWPERIGFINLIRATRECHVLPYRLKGSSMLRTLELLHRVWRTQTRAEPRPGVHCRDCPYQGNGCEVAYVHGGA